MIPISMQLAEVLSPEIREGEYLGDDGLIRCAQCHGRRQLTVNIEGRLFCPRIQCSCQSVAYETQKQERKTAELRDRIQRNRTHGLPELVLRGYTFERDEGHTPDLIIKVRRYAENWEAMYQKGMGLLLWGDVGTGKSFAVGCIANYLLDRGISVMMTNFTKVLNALTNLQWGDRNQYIDELNRYDLLIIDDLGIERGTEYVLEQVYSIIDSRYRSGKPLIVTTNLTLQQMSQPQDVAHARIYDRVLERCVPIRVCGRNIRQANAAENMKLARELLCGND